MNPDGPPPIFCWCSDPDCNAVAEIIDRWQVPSTDGPIEHVHVLCCAGHPFRLPADWVRLMD